MGPREIVVIFAIVVSFALVPPIIKWVDFSQKIGRAEELENNGNYAAALVVLEQAKIDATNSQKEEIDLDLTRLKFLAKIQDLFNQIQELIRKGKFEQAINLLKDADKMLAETNLEIDLSWARENIKNYKAICNQLAKDKSNYLKGIEKFNNKDWQGAIDFLSKVSQESLYREEAQKKIYIAEEKKAEAEAPQEEEWECDYDKCVENCMEGCRKNKSFIVCDIECDAACSGMQDACEMLNESLYKPLLNY